MNHDEATRLLGPHWLKIFVDWVPLGPKCQLLAEAMSFSKCRGGACFASLDTLSQRTGLSRSQCCKHKNRLLQDGLLESVEVHGRSAFKISRSAMAMVGPDERYLSVPAMQLKVLSWYERLVVGAVINEWLMPIGNGLSMCDQAAVRFGSWRHLARRSGLPENRSTDVRRACQRLAHDGILSCDFHDGAIFIEVLTTDLDPETKRRGSRNETGATRNETGATRNETRVARF